ncbi:sensor histidine kinase [Chloroflexota bacterium]
MFGLDSRISDLLIIHPYVMIRYEMLTPRQIIAWLGKTNPAIEHRAWSCADNPTLVKLHSLVCHELYTFFLELFYGVVINLLGNASEFSPEGEEIVLSAKEDDGNIVVEVDDNGPGIARKDIEEIFEPYYRVEVDRQRLPGLGLGLALCKRTVELHGGKIWVKSRKGKGSTFGFSIPLASRHQLKGTTEG